MDDKRVIMVLNQKNWNVKTLREQFLDALLTKYDKDEVTSFFYLLTEKYLGLRRVDVAMQLDKEVSSDQIQMFVQSIEQLKKSIPIQYILRETEFYGFTFQVNPAVLIPRPETEELVDWVVKDQENDIKKNVKILDIGTGSGCIAISLAKKLKEAKVTVIDVSEDAIKVAKENAMKHEVELQFLKSDVLDLRELPGKFDVIVSNPPYVRELEKQEMKSNVLDNEPHQALFVTNESPLVFYEKITELALEALTPNGVLYFEINQYLGDATVAMIKNRGFTSVQLRKDLYGNDRMIKASIK